MGLAEVAVLVGGTAAVAVLARHFFAPKAAHAATVRGGVQEADVEVKAGYSPDVVRVEAGTPVRLIFNRQDNSGCTERVVLRRLQPRAQPGCPDGGVTGGRGPTSLSERS